MATDPVQRIAGDSGHITDHDKLHARVTSIHSVKEPAYGAAGDGATDDTTAIQNAITAAAVSGGIVFFPSGTYVFTQINLASNVHLMGAADRSSILKLKNTTNTDNVIRGATITTASIRQLTVDYNHANNATSQIGMRIDNSSYVTVDRCTFLNCRGFAVSFAGDNASRNDHCTVSNCNVLSPISSPNDMVLVVSDYGVVRSNRIVGTNANIALVLYESDHLQAWGNEVELASGAGHTGIGVLSCRYANVYGNKVVGAGNGVGIAVYTEHDNPAPIASERNSVWGNSLYNVGSGFQLLETNYDRVVSNRVELTSNAVEFPASTAAQAGNLVLADNDFRYNNTNIVTNSGSANVNLWFQRNQTNGSIVPTVSAVTNLALPFGEEVVAISGNTNVVNILANGHAGRRVTLVGAAGSSAVLNDSTGAGNLRLTTNFAGVADATITLACDGNLWYEVARSAN